MAHSRAHLSFLEQARLPGRRAALIGIAALALVGAGAVVLRPSRPAPIEGHAFAVPVPDGRIAVEVLNGTGRQGLARLATRLLRREGLDVVSFGNADSAAATTRVVVRRGDPAHGSTVAEALGYGAAAVAVEEDSVRRVDVSVILGDDFTAPEDGQP